MVTANPERAAKLSAAVGKAFGELFTFTARKVAANSDVNLPRIADAARPEFSITGVWSAGGKAKNLPARGHADSQGQATIAASPAVTIEDAALAAPKWLPQENDLCTRAADGATYTVSRVIPDGVGRTKFTLTAKKR